MIIHFISIVNWYIRISKKTYYLRTNGRKYGFIVILWS